jgi:type I restriction enzyme S subunit
MGSLRENAWLVMSKSTRHNWETKKLGEICEEIKKEKALMGTIPYIEIGNIDVNSKKVIFTEKGAVNGSIYAPENSILISRVRPTRGAITFVDKKIAVSSAFTIIKPKADYNPKLLFYFLAWNKKFFDYLGERQKGTNYPSVREEDILEFEVVFPENKEEQQKIVKILDTIQEAIDIYDKIIEKTKELKKSLMGDLFKYGAPSFRRGRKLKKTEIGELPEDWEVVRLGEVIEKPQYGITAAATNKNTGIKFLRITDIQEEKVNWKLVPFCECNKEDLKKYELKEKDIVVARIGATTGKSFFIKSAPKCIFGSYLIRIRAKFSLYPDFLNYYFQTDIYWFQLNLAKGGRLKGGINIPILENLLLPLPPLPEQQEIAEILQTIDQKIEIEKRKKELYEELFKTMLNKIINQEVEVENFEV